MTSPRPQLAPRTLISVLSNWGAFALSVVISFFLAPFVIARLGDSAYGIWTLLGSITGYLGLLDLGVRAAVTRYIAKYHTQGEHQLSSQVASSSLAIFSLAGLVAFLVSCFVAVFLADGFNIPLELLGAARIVLVLSGASIAVSLISGVFAGSLVALHRFATLNSIDALLSLVRSGLVIAALMLGHGLIALAVINLGMGLLRFGIVVVLSHRVYPELFVSLRLVTRGSIRMIFSFSVYSFLIQIGANLIYYTDTVIIGTALPVSMITFYAIGGSLIEYAISLVSGISQPMAPLASSIEARGDAEGLRRLVLKSSRYATMLVLPITATFILRGESFIGLWMGPQYSGISGEVLVVLALAVSLAAANRPAGSIMAGIGRHQPLVPLLLIEGVLNMALSLWLVRTVGIVGVAWGTAIPNVLTQLVFWPAYIRRAVGVPILAYAREAWFRPIVSILPFALGSWLLDRLFPAQTLFGFFSQIVASLPLAGITYWILCVSAEERLAVRGYLLKALSLAGLRR